MPATARPILARADLERFDLHAPRHRGRYRVCCPLCGAGKPVDAAHRSLTVNDADGLWYCHRCALGGQLREHWPERERSSDRRQRVTAWAAWAFGTPSATPPQPTNVAFAAPLRAPAREAVHTVAPPPTRDPRPDLEADAALWSLLLDLSHTLGHHEAGDGLHGALDGARCFGARLELAGDTLRLSAGEDAEAYAQVREHLRPHSAQLVALLRMAAYSAGARMAG